MVKVKRSMCLARRLVYEDYPDQPRDACGAAGVFKSARRTLYYDYNIPVKVGVSLSVLTVPERCPTGNQKKRRWFSYKSSYNRIGPTRLLMIAAKLQIPLESMEKP
jgi:hypothetical protein